MNDDLMRRLAAADPVRGTDLPRPEATMREAIMRTDVDEGRAAVGRRRRRRAFLAGGAAVALLGGAVPSRRTRTGTSGPQVRTW